MKELRNERETRVRRQEEAPYDAAFFADREGELDFIKKKLATAAAGLYRPFIEVVGVRGIGKSWLLAHIQHLYRWNGPESCEIKPPTVCALADLKEYQRVGQGAALLGGMAHQLRSQLGDVGSDYAGHWPAPKEAMPAGSFVALVRALTAHFTPILIFDTVELAEPALLEWLETEVLFDLLRTERVLVVVSGRKRMRWKEFEVRRRRDLLEVGAFRRSAARQQLHKLEAETIADPLYEYTAGHPGANRILRDELVQLSQRTGRPLDTALVREKAEEVAAILKQKVVEAYFLSLAEGWLQPLLRGISVLRQFHPTTLRDFAIQFEQPGRGAKPYAEERGGFYLDTVRAMVDTTLVTWRSTLGGYALAPVVRRILSHQLLLEDKEDFIRRNEFAAALYEEWMGTDPERSSCFLLEWLYHRGQVLLAETGEPTTLPDEFQTKLQELPRTLDVAAALYDGLEHDDELEDVLGPTYERLKLAAQAFEREVGEEAVSGG